MCLPPSKNLLAIKRNFYKTCPGGEACEGDSLLVTIRKTTEIQVSALQGDLEHKISFNSSVQEALNFVDLMR
ncbi:Uncharacterized protein HZ326_13927 [Fusarium oxysporum f. sp. albedinis]|nr:Uncharacterized protein HZ326_13927 [Fusarium oxysporum f. sp. albedinis]